jgi:non-ribosomal peptide synthetase component F/acyl carrier protein
MSGVEEAVFEAWAVAVSGPDPAGPAPDPAGPAPDPAGPAPDPDLPFSAVGGQSLGAARLVAALRQRLSVEVPLARVLVDDPTPRELVDIVRSLGRSDPVAEAAAGGDVRAGVPARAALPSEAVPVWVFHRVHPASPAYNVARVLTVPGLVRPAVLRAALADVTRRHQAMRAGVLDSRPGVPEVVVRSQVPVGLGVTVARTGTGAGPDWEVDCPPGVLAAVEAARDEPFDMATPPLWRVRLVHAPELARSWLVLVMHHVLADLRATDLVLRDLATAYAARLAGRSPEFGAAPDLIAQLAAASAPAGDRRPDVERWAGRLAEQPPARLLPLALGPGDDLDFRADTVTRTIPAADVDSLVERCRLTPPLVLLTAARVVLAAWRGPRGTDVAGVPTARIRRPEDEDVVSFQLDTALVADPVDVGAGFGAAAATVRSAYLRALEPDAATFADVLRRVPGQRFGARSPLVGFWFNDLTLARPPAELAGRPCAEYDLRPAWALFDLGLYVRRVAAGLRLHLVTARGLLADGDRTACLDQICRLLHRAAQDPSRPLAALLPPDLVTAAPADAAPTVDPTARLLRRHADRTPDEPALRDAAGELSYAELAAAVSARAAGWSAEHRIGLTARRDRQHVVDLLAVLESGAAAVLVDASWPAQRRRGAFTAGRPTELAGEDADAGLPLAPPAPGVGGHAVLFTSGSTGTPLGVRTGHDVIERCVAELGAWLAVTAADRVAFLSGPAHDPVWRDVLLPVRAGATLCIPPLEVQEDPSTLVRWLRAERISVLGGSPLLLGLALDADPDPLPDLRVAVCGGAPLSRPTAELLRSAAPNATLVNGYGCTETPQLVAALRLEPSAGVPGWPQLPAGGAMPGRRLEVRTAAGARCDVGQLGTVRVAEPYLAAGYVEPAGPAADRFRPDAAGVRWFDTGDLARYDSAGRIHLAGRADRQVLVNGHRLLLDEVEAAARAVAGVREAVAQVVRGGSADSLRLFVRRDPVAALTGAQVRDRLAAVLPSAAVPARVEVGTELALDANLKPVASAASATSAAAEPVAGESVAGESVAGESVAGEIRALAEAVLGGPVDPTSNFFDAGFTSITLLQLSSELAASLDREIPAVTLFRHPSLAQLQRHLTGEAPAAPAVRARPSRGVTDPRRAGRRALRRRIRTAVHETPPADPE